MVVALSMGNLQALDLAADHPERVAAWVALAPAIRDLAPFPAGRQASFDRWNEDTGDDDGWGRYNRFSWLRDYPGFLDFFFDQLVPEEPLDQADRGPRGVGAGHRRRDARPGRGGSRPG